MVPKLGWCFLLVTVLLPRDSSEASIASTERCPISSDVCSCVFNSNSFYTVKCRNISSEDILREAISNLNDNALYLQASQLNLKYFPLKMLNNVSLHTLIVANSTFEVFRDVLKDETSLPNFVLEHLSLENVTMYNDWNWNQLHSLRSLKVLSIYNTTIGEKITSDLSKNINPNITAITIAESNLTTIESGSFDKLDALKYLRICDSNLTSVSRYMLPVPSHIEQLRFENNKIHSLPCDIFNAMPNLKVVSFSNNTLSTLPEEVFKQIWRPGIHLELRGNPIKCDCRLLWTVTSETKPEDVIGHCTYPKKLFGKSLKELTVDDLTCSH
ncbi:leucine-rich repeat and immunoglobulin-like domain-containing nogo receptor-interacting protein 1 [Uloborus diversus]|uniref:leucine-rich repeat and immunoglobulin-like domain-containing nogo receptor-interacting protein 1 n=1 Tax=Uloborus diversus TaxID=327109 RepID=UPI002409CEED|nr:leucine-rich repeat and immunoglobulin-like domain-containing nogo receptor-interacting protein 1 [Uloborus diversus]